MDNIVNKNISQKIRRPFGVWILTIHAVIVAFWGFMVNNSDLVLKGEVAMFASDEVPFMLLWAYLCIGVFIASFLTWIGWEPGRISFLILTSTFYLLLGEDIFLWITNPHFWKILPWETVWDDIVPTIFLFIGCIMTPVLYIWYFNKPSTRAFYAKVKK
ncbi:MAG: hypothetical protein KF758_01210 [Anaerolineales bacterium]|nr:hypothetical protein [Anaerolineales bacterium]